MEPGAVITLHTGSGENTNSDMYWGSRSAIWNNGGDVILIKDPGGKVVVKEEYG